MPKLGVLTAAEVWAQATRTLTDISAEEIFDLPDITVTYPPVNVASWIELVADVGTGKRLVWVSATIVSAANVGFVLELGEGTGSNESRIAAMNGRNRYSSDVGPNITVHRMLWRALSDNARLSARAKDDDGGAVTYTIVLGYA